MGLKGIPKLITPDLLKVLSEMGHGDEIGLCVPEVLEAILKLFPLDEYVDSPVSVMQPVNSDLPLGDPPIWAQYQRILNQSQHSEVSIERVERFAFYERAANAYAVVHTGEVAKYGNIILKKGLVV